MGNLLLPRPENIRGRFGTYVTSDLFRIAERLQEIDRNLFIQSLDPPVRGFGHEYHFTIAEWIPELRREEFVMRVEELDARVIEACQRMLAIPFAKRFAEYEKLEAKWAEEERERQLDEMYEKVGGPMLPLLESCGFINSRPISYPKRNATARRHRNFKGLGGMSAKGGELILPAGARV